jgi:hypothetical protein
MTSKAKVITNLSRSISVAMATGGKNSQYEAFASKAVDCLNAGDDFRATGFGFVVATLYFAHKEQAFKADDGVVMADIATLFKAEDATKSKGLAYIYRHAFKADPEDAEKDKRPSASLINAVSRAILIVPYLLQMEANAKAEAEKHRKTAKTFPDAIPALSIFSGNPTKYVLPGAAMIAAYAILNRRKVRDDKTISNEYTDSVQKMRDLVAVAGESEIYTRWMVQSKTRELTTNLFNWKILEDTARQYLSIQVKTRGRKAADTRKENDNALAAASVGQLTTTLGEKASKLSQMSGTEQEAVTEAFENIVSVAPRVLFSTMQQFIGNCDAKDCPADIVAYLEGIAEDIAELLSERKKSATPAKQVANKSVAA